MRFEFRTRHHRQARLPPRNFQIRVTHDYKKLRARVARTMTRLRHDSAPTATARRAKKLALQGFSWTRKGIDSRVAFVENDSGNVGAATRDARRADRTLKRGARLLRAAGSILGVPVGSLNGF